MVLSSTKFYSDNKDILLIFIIKLGLPRWCSGKEFACQCRRHKRRRFILGQDDYPRVENNNPLSYSCLGNPMDSVACWATVQRVAKNWTWLSDWACTHILKLKICIFFYQNNHEQGSGGISPHSGIRAAHSGFNNSIRRQKVGPILKQWQSRHHCLLGDQPELFSLSLLPVYVNHTRSSGLPGFLSLHTF